MIGLLQCHLAFINNQFQYNTVYFLKNIMKEDKIIDLSEISPEVSMIVPKIPTTNSPKHSNSQPHLPEPTTAVPSKYLISDLLSSSKIYVKPSGNKVCIYAGNVVLT